MKKKILVACLCVALAVLTVAGTTLAYLTSQDKVTNTFTVGNVAITLDEKDVDNSTPDAERDKANAYLLMPGKNYEKDPTVHVNPVSENSWIFVKVENGIAAFEAANSADANGYKTIANQITANGWTALDNVDGVYYKSYTKSTTGADLVVFREFQLSDTANNETGWKDIGNTIAGSTGKVGDIVVTAYAVQADGFNTAIAAWNATFGK